MVQRLLKPKQIPDVKSALVMLTSREATLAEFHDQTGEEVVNDFTRRELMVSLVPKDVFTRLATCLC